MEKEEFKKLNIRQQLEYVGKRRANGEKLSSIAYDLDYSYSYDISNYFREKGYRYDNYCKRYVEATNSSALKGSDFQDLKELVKYKSDILEMLKEYKSNTKVFKSVQLDIERLPKELQKDVKNNSIKMYEPICEKFDKLCSRYNNYKKRDLIALALYEFCLKYKK